MMPGIQYRRLARGASSAIALAMAIAGGSAFAMDWPLSPPRLAATFGTFAKGRVITGVALAADEGLVRATEDGELSFSLEDGAYPNALPSPLGSFVVIEHQRGMAAVYSHLAPGSLSTYLKKPKSGDILGKPGSSGWIEGSGVVFQVFDHSAASWVNPLLILPPLADDKPPIIRSLALSRADKVFVMGQANSVPQGTYGISVDVSDPADSPWTAGPLAPYSILLAIDGIEAAKDVFDVAKGVSGELMLFVHSPAASSKLRTKEGRYSIADRLFTRGRTVMEVRVEDAAGNRRTASWTVLVE
jgi:murein DD-endopeptidase MepM/ murein hydrolase activator NlpD